MSYFQVFFQKQVYIVYFVPKYTKLDEKIKQLQNLFHTDCHKYTCILNQLNLTTCITPIENKSFLLPIKNFLIKVITLTYEKN